VIAKRGLYDIPGRSQFSRIAGYDIHSCLQNVGKVGTGCGQSLGQVIDGLPGLNTGIACADNCLVFINRASACGEDQGPGRGDRRVRVRDTAVEPFGPNQLNSHPRYVVILATAQATVIRLRGGGENSRLRMGCVFPAALNREYTPHVRPVCTESEA